MKILGLVKNVANGLNPIGKDDDKEQPKTKAEKQPAAKKPPTVEEQLEVISARLDQLTDKMDEPVPAKKPQDPNAELAEAVVKYAYKQGTAAVRSAATAATNAAFFGAGKVVGNTLDTVKGAVTHPLQTAHGAHGGIRETAKSVIKSEPVQDAFESFRKGMSDE